MYLHSTILQMYAKTPLLDFIFWSHGVVGGWLWNVLYTLHYSTLSYCLFSSCLEGEIGWGEMYGVGVSVHGGKQVNGCMPSLNNKTWKCLTWIVKVFEFQQLHELCWRTSTWKWDWKNPFTIWGSDLSLCASRGGHYQFKMCYDFCFCCWFRRRVPS